MTRRRVELPKQRWQFEAYAGIICVAAAVAAFGLASGAAYIQEDWDVAGAAEAVSPVVGGLAVTSGLAFVAGLFRFAFRYGK